MRKLVFMAVVLAVAACVVWNRAGVEGLFYKVKRAHAEHEKKQVLKDWETHFARALDRLEKEKKRLLRKIDAQRIELEKDRARHEIRASKQERYGRVVADFRKAASRGQVSFAGRTYDRKSARLQLARFDAELAGYRKRTELVAARIAARRAGIEGLEKVAARLEARINDLTVEGERMLVERERLELSRRLRAIEEMGRKASGPGRIAARSARARRLLEIMEDALLEERAAERARRRGKPAGTVSLADGAVAPRAQ